MPACLSSPAPASTPLDGVARLPDLGVIRARGADAASFLQAQLTQDMEQIHLGRGRLAALCNARGRMLASFIFSTSSKAATGNPGSLDGSRRTRRGTVNPPGSISPPTRKST